jgi:beta-lactamase regulating signal transducer with metallopeptidase domain
MEYAFGVLFGATWQAAVFIGILLPLSFCVRRAAARCALWTSCVLGLALMPVASLCLPHCYIAYAGTAEPLHFPTLIARNLGTASAVDRVWTLANDTWLTHVCQVLVVVWAAGAAVSFMRLVWSWVRVAGLLHMARPCQDDRVLQIVGRVIATPNSVSVLQMHGLVGAICWQIHRPKIILPEDLTRLTDAELEMMVRHEWTHLKRSDPGTLFVQRLVEVFYWFHPLVWLATMQLSKYREFVCDDAVVTSGFAPAAYARCLGQLAVWYYAPMPLAPAGLGLLWNQHLVLLRVKRLLRPSQSRGELIGTQRFALSLVAAVVLCICSVTRLDWNETAFVGRARWTAWPRYSAAVLDTIGLQVRDFPLDAHRYDPDNTGRHAGPSVHIAN